MKPASLARLLTAFIILTAASTMIAQGTAFTYQGRLTDSGQPANGNYDLQFTLKDAAAAGNTVGVPITVAPVSISNGLFTVTLDFGAGAFAGQPRWLEIGVRTNGSVSAHAILAPRQAVTATPYAIQALTADSAVSAATLTGTIPASSLTGTLPDARLSANVALLNSSPSFGGDLAALRLRIGPDQVLTGTYATIAGGTQNTNLATLSAIGGGSRNTIQVDAHDSAIAGGNNNLIETKAHVSTIGGGEFNTIRSNAFQSTIGGGVLNDIQTNAFHSTIAGGFFNLIQSSGSTISGGENNTIQSNSVHSYLGGGNQNTIQTNASASMIGGGQNNVVLTNAHYATIPGGQDNQAGGSFSFAAGRRAKANHAGSFAWGDSTEADLITTGNNQFLIRALGGVGIGTNNPQSALHVAGTVTAAAFTGDGAGLTNVPGALAWQAVPGTAQTAAANQAYLLTNPAPTTLILPASANVGDIVRVSGAGAGGWQITPNTGQTIAGYTTIPAGTKWTPRENNRNWQAVASSADGTKLVAAVYGGPIYTSTDSGVTWTARGPGLSWTSVASSTDGAKLVAVGQQIYTSTDSGVTWTARETPRSWQSVASSADGTKLVATVYGGQIYTSTDSGVSWTARAFGFPWQSAEEADGTKLVAVPYGPNIYTSTDSGVTWTARESNRNWRSVASSTDGSKLVAASENGQIWTSTDSGVTWTARESNRNWRSVASSADGTKLVAAVYGGHIYISTDSGVTWTPQPDLSPNWQSVASSADGTRLVAVVYGGQIYTSRDEEPAISGGAGTTASLQYLGSGQWLPLGEAQVAATLNDNTWQTGGNAGTTPGTHFLGTTDNQPLQFIVDGARALRLIPNATSPNIVGGHAANSVADGVYGSIIGGGGTATLPNSIKSDLSIIGGGFRNTIETNASTSTIAGGGLNTIERSYPSGFSAIGGGFGNTIKTNASGSTIGGGENHTIQANAGWATIGGGYGNIVQTNATYATIPGGYNAKAANYGQMAYASGRFAVWGDAQTSTFVLRRSLTSAASELLYLDGSAKSLAIPVGATWSFDILVVGRGANGQSAGYQIKGVIENAGGATAFVGTPTVTELGEDDATWSASVQANDTADELNILVAGSASTTIRWVATVRTAEVIY